MKKGKNPNNGSYCIVSSNPIWPPKIDQPIGQKWDNLDDLFTFPGPEDLLDWNRWDETFLSREMDVKKFFVCVGDTIRSIPCFVSNELPRSNFSK